MTVKVLSITDQPDFARLLQHHISTFMDSVELRVYSPAERGALHESFVAAGYDLVLLDEQLNNQQGMSWFSALAARPGFAPIIFFSDLPESLHMAPDVMRACLNRRINNREFASALRAAVERRRREMNSLSMRQELEKNYRFGDVTIRGQRFIRELGKGGTSRVYLAESEKEGEVMVLKVLDHNPETADSSEGYDRFLQEYELLASLRHPNVVHIYDFGVADDHAFIAMEYFPHGDLRRRMAQPMSTKEVLNYVEQIARALGAVHKVGITHRDLKPGNIMLRADDSLALIDFGVAKQLQNKESITAAGTIFGTPYYMSPEQGHGEPTDERSDLYSLGVMFYELLTQKRPYTSDTAMNVIYMHRNAPLPDLPANVAWLEPAVHRLMAKQPKHRFQSAAELISTLGLMRLMASTAAS
jgi:eukaryotic-like serine/threonine-protein kinase